MPNLREYPEWPNPRHEEIINKVFGQPQPSLYDEISELRKEIRELKEMLVPVESLIITGKSVINEFLKISGRKEL